MPFLGKDWRSTGDLWVRTAHGWETAKNWRVQIHENINYIVLQKLLRQSITEPEKEGELIECPKRQLYIHIPQRTPSRISNGQTQVGFTEAVSTLDFTGALRDSRRCNYVYKLMELLVEEHMLDLSGGGQTQLIALLQSALVNVSETKNNPKQLISILEKLLSAIREYPWCFKHVGSDKLWSKHYMEVEMMLDKAKSVPTPEREGSDGASLTDMPDDIIRYILLHLTSHDDVMHAGRASEQIWHLVNDSLLWKDMCHCHYTAEQISAVISSPQFYAQAGSVDWYEVYNKLHRRHGHNEAFADMLMFCKRCSVIYWKLIGHPCKGIHESEPVTPKRFLEMFHV